MDDQKRREILALLQSNACLTPAQIATMVSEREDAVEKEIAAMKADRVILRYAAIVDWEKAGSERVTARIDVKIQPQRDVGFNRLAERISRFPEVTSCYLMSGTYDLSVEVETDSLKEVANFVSERLSALDGVSSTMTYFVMKRYKHDGVLFGDAEDDERLAVTP